MVVIRGTNDDEISHFALLTLSDAWHVRFIEFMPLDSARAWQKEMVVTGTEVLQRLRINRRCRTLTRLRDRAWADVRSRVRARSLKCLGNRLGRARLKQDSHPLSSFRAL
jgi:molybdenum cofactor biosynthesis enzyme MoaA